MVAIPLVTDMNAQLFRAATNMLEHRGLRLLSELTVFDKYARYIEAERRRETWDEIIDRNCEMHCRRYPGVADEIRALYRAFVFPKVVLPSMRSLQFAGKPIELVNSRLMNCAATPIDDPRAFREIMFLLLGGTGVGFSVQTAHINQLPRVTQPVTTRRYVIQDSIIGWAEAVDALFKAYLCGKPKPLFVYDDIRPRGARLRTTGGRAPGPDGLRVALENVDARLAAMPHGHQMRPIEVHDLICFIAQSVLSGGIRRSAMISLFDFDDEEMIHAKSGQWWVDNPQRALANNSAMALRHRITRRQFDQFMGRVEESGAGEPGIYFGNDPNSLTNPCFKADTLVTTRQGVRQIKDLVGQSVEVWDGSGWVTVDNFRVTGENQPTLEIELHDGSSVVVTPYHTMILEDGTRVEARHLSVGDRLAVGNVAFDGADQEIDPFERGEDAALACMDDGVVFPLDVFSWSRDSRGAFVDGVVQTAIPDFNFPRNHGVYDIVSVSHDWVEKFQTLLKTVGVFGTVIRQVEGPEVELLEDKKLWVLELPHTIFTKAYKPGNEWNQVKAIRPAAVESRVYCCTVDSTNSLTIGIGIQTGQCAEASVNQNFCNLTTFNFSVIESQQDLRDFAKAAAFLGTLQAGYTDYHYLRPVWQERTEKEALLGVSMTGIARSDFSRFDLRDAAQQVIETNQQIARQIGINSAYRLTVNKPEGTSSAVLQTSSGVHAWHDRYFIRRTRYSADSPLVRHLRETLPDAVEADRRDPSLAVVSLPCRAPDNAITRHEPMDQLLDRIHRCSTEWVREGHRKGHNGHSVSATVSVKPNEWGRLRDWMWNHRYQYNGLSVLPYDGGTYEQAPFETISPAQYHALAQQLPDTLALHRVTEVDDGTEHSQEVACAGGACTI